MKIRNVPTILGIIIVAAFLLTPLVLQMHHQSQSIQGAGTAVTQPTSSSSAPTSQPTVIAVIPDFTGASWKGPVRVHVGSVFYIAVKNFNLIKELPEKAAQSNPTPPPITFKFLQNFSLIINGTITQLHPDLGSYAITEPTPVTYLRFTLDRDDAVQTLLAKVRHDSELAEGRVNNSAVRCPAFEFPVEVTLSAPDGTLLNTDLHWNSPNTLVLSLVATDWWYLGAATILFALCALVFLAKNTRILRDTVSPVRPDGRHTFSLGRVQMAFWFFLVIAAYWLIFSVTGISDVAIPQSLLILTGISASTALGAAFIDSQATKTKPIWLPLSEIAGDLKGRSRRELLLLLREQEALRLDTSNTSITIDKRLAEIRTAIFAAQSPFSRFLSDILREDGAIAFHRFQIVCWTLLLGIQFVMLVFRDLQMPNFNNTLLTLQGISAGTYLGFKIPSSTETKA